MSTLVALHVGAASVRASLFDGDGLLLDEQWAPCPPSARAGGQRTQSPTRWWHLASQCLRALDTRATRARALALSADRPSLVVLAPDGAAIAALVAGDVRFGATEPPRAPWSGDAALALERLADHAGASTSAGVRAGDALTLFGERLTGVRARDGSWGASEAARKLDPRWLPPLDPGAVIGALTERAARETALPAAIAVVHAGPTPLVERYGRGLVEGSGDSLLTFDGAATVTVDVPQAHRSAAAARCATVDPAFALDVEPAPVAERLRELGAALALGGSLAPLAASAAEIDEATRAFARWLDARQRHDARSGAPWRSLTIASHLGRLARVRRTIEEATGVAVHASVDSSCASRGAAWIAARALDPSMTPWSAPSDR